MDTSKQRPSVNLSYRDDDALLRALLAINANLPPQARAQQQRSPLRPAEQAQYQKLDDQRRSFVSPTGDPLNVSRPLPQGPGPAERPPPFPENLAPDGRARQATLDDILRNLEVPSQGPPQPTFMAQNDAAKPDEVIGRLLRGEGTDTDQYGPLMSGLIRAAGPMPPPRGRIR